jgi:hypothetical protein
MWIIQNDDNLEFRANDIQHDILQILIAENTSSIIWKSQQNCYDKIAQTLYAVEWQEGEEKEIEIEEADEQGNLVKTLQKTRGPSTPKRLGNFYLFDEPTLRVYNALKEEILNQEFVKVYDPNNNPPA